DVQVVALSGASVEELKNQLGEWENPGGRGSRRAAGPEGTRGQARQEPRPPREPRPPGEPSPPAGAPPADWAAIRARAAASGAGFDAAHPHRLLFVLTRDKADDALPRRAGQLLDQNAGKASWYSPEGIAYGSGPAPGQLGFLFPGQGAQAV